MGIGHIWGINSLTSLSSLGDTHRGAYVYPTEVCLLLFQAFTKKNIPCNKKRKDCLHASLEQAL